MGHSRRRKGDGFQKHLVFNGATAVVKQCAEIILIRLGQSSYRIRPVLLLFMSKERKTVIVQNKILELSFKIQFSIHLYMKQVVRGCREKKTEGQIDYNKS